MDALRHNHTWDVVDRPTDRKIVDSKWVFKIKRLSEQIRRQIQSTISGKEIFPNPGTGLR
jgi:uncharacterized lipoprotein